MSDVEGMDGYNSDPAKGLLEGAAAFHLSLSGEQIAQFAYYQEQLLAWNQRLNLTAITGQREIQVRHFLDSISCGTVTGDLTGQRLIDVGTGAGFPGVPLKILYPGLRLTLLESVAKKADFLHDLVAGLGLEQVSIIVERAEVLGRSAEHRERYDWAVARSVARMPVLAEYLLPLCRMGGYMLAQKGAGAPDEVAAAARAIATLGGAPPGLHPIQLPGEIELHYLVTVEKILKTPAFYPRRTGIPAKRPL